MFTRKAVCANAAVVFVAGAAVAAETPTLRHMSRPRREIKQPGTVQHRAGRQAGLPPGSGTPKQGEAIFNQKCVGCHNQVGAAWPQRLAGRRTAYRFTPMR